MGAEHYNDMHVYLRSTIQNGGVYLKKSEPILLTGSAGGIPPEPPFRPPRQKAEAERTISSFSNPALRDCEVMPRLAANSFI